MMTLEEVQNLRNVGIRGRAEALIETCEAALRVVEVGKELDKYFLSNADEYKTVMEFREALEPFLNKPSAEERFK